MANIEHELAYYESKWIRNLTRRLLVDLIQNEFSTPISSATLSRRDILEQFKTVLSSCDDRVLWERFRYRRFWQDRKYCSYGLFNRLQPATPHTTLLHTHRTDKGVVVPAVASFYDPRGVVFYRTNLIPERYVRVVTTVFVRDEFARRFVDFLIVPLLHLVHGYWYELPTG